jgi:hypothetical protein
VVPAGYRGGPGIKIKQAIVSPSHVLRIGPRSWPLVAAPVALAASAVGVTVSVAAEMALLTAIVAVTGRGAAGEGGR